jgi:hypothetical protein
VFGCFRLIGRILGERVCTLQVVNTIIENEKVSFPVPQEMLEVKNLNGHYSRARAGSANQIFGGRRKGLRNY